jgi:ABC-type uncharacterized transport system permease subunit
MNVDGWLWAHFGLILAGFVGLATAVFSAALYLWQSSQLKSKHPGRSFMRLPSLDALDTVHFRALVWGVGLFSLGLFAGVVWATDLRELGGVLRDSRAVLSLITCVLFWAIVSLRLSALRRGQKIAAGTLIVFLLLFLTIASSYVVPGTFHGGA